MEATLELIRHQLLQLGNWSPQSPAGFPRDTRCHRPMGYTADEDIRVWYRSSRLKKTPKWGRGHRDIISTQQLWIVRATCMSPMNREHFASVCIDNKRYKICSTDITSSRGGNQLDIQLQSMGSFTKNIFLSFLLFYESLKTLSTIPCSHQPAQFLQREKNKTCLSPVLWVL